MYFNNFSASRIEGRKKRLEEYLNNVSQLINFIDYNEVCDFLEVESHTRTLLLSLEFDEDQMVSQSKKLAEKCGLDLSQFENLIRREGIKMHEFIKKLNDAPLMIAKSVKEFENY